VIEKKYKNMPDNNNDVTTKSYLDDKSSDLGVEISKRINRQVEREQLFKRELVSLLKSSSLVDDKRLERLEDLI